MNEAHTASGLATLLWYDKETTQVPVYESGQQTGKWETIPVIDGAVLVSVADELAARSGGALRSAVRRDVAAGKRVSHGVRYLMRPYKKQK